MTPQDYEDTFHYIKRNITAISQFAVEHAIKEKLMGMLQEYYDEVTQDCDSQQEVDDVLSRTDELDYWYAYGDRVDLNYTSRGLKTLKCWAYPVVNAVPNYDQEYEIEIDITELEKTNA